MIFENMFCCTRRIMEKRLTHVHSFTCLLKVFLEYLIRLRGDFMIFENRLYCARRIMSMTTL